MAGRIEGIQTPSPTTNVPWDFSRGHGSPSPIHAEPHRPVTSQQSSPTTSRHQHNHQLAGRWRIALRCKQHAGTQEWIKCKQDACVHLRDELHHLLECPRRVIGGCIERCQALREELRKFRELLPKSRTFPNQWLWTYGSSHSPSGECGELQAKMQALKIQEFVRFCAYSPTSPAISEPFWSLGERTQGSGSGENVEAPVVELIPLDQTRLSVNNGCFRKRHEWEKITFLGRGTFGSTYLCYDKNRGSHFAIKKLPIANFREDELKIWQKLCTNEHPNILDIYGAVQRKERVLIFMEYMYGGSIGDYLAQHGKMDESSALNILQQVLSGLEFMHRRRIIHGDIKADNVLMDELRLHIKLADFGSCIDLNVVENARPSSLTGTLAFMSPEVCRSEMPAPSSDIWSAMCFLLQMLNAEPPWEDYRHQTGEALLYVIGSAKRPPRLPECSEYVQEIFALGLNVEASSRPSAAQLLRHRVFGDGVVESIVDDEGEEDRSFQTEHDLASMSAESGEYHSLCSIDTIDEYLSLDEDFDEQFASKRSNAKVIKRVDSKGGQLKITNVEVTIPEGALPDDTTLAITCVDPRKFYQPIIDNDIEDKVTILGDAYKLHPSGQKFDEDVSVKVTLPEGLHQSEDLRIFHGTLDANHNLSWTELEKHVLPFKHSSLVKVSVNHFSYLLSLKSLSSLAYEFISTYFNNRSVFFWFIVFTRRDEDNPKRLAVRLVIQRDSFYSHGTEDLFKEHCIAHRLKEEGFCDMFGSRREYVCPSEDLEFSLEGVCDRSCQPTHHSVADPFGGEQVAEWELDTGDELQPISGTVLIKRAAGQMYRFQFWQHNPTKYVQDVLELRTLTYTNMLPLATALGLSQEEVADLVEETGGDEEQQLKRITECWSRKAENNELPGGLDDFIANVPREAVLVSERSKSHLSHLSEFSQKWSEHVKKPTSGLDEDMYLKQMAENGEDVCHSVFSDIFLQTEHSKEALRLATDRQKLSVIMAKVLEIVGKSYADSVLEKLKSFREVYMSYHADRSNVMQCDCFCRRLCDCIPLLMQVVKDGFKVHQSIQPTGVWGLQAQCDSSQEGPEQVLRSNDVWCKIMEVLVKLCEANSTVSSPNCDSSTSNIPDPVITELGDTLNATELLHKLSIGDKEWLRIASRIKYYHRFLREIVKGNLSRTHSADMRNVLRCLQSYVTFCPTRLVQFSFTTDKVQKETLLYDESNYTFTQRLSVVLEDASNLNFAIKVEVCIKGCRLSAEVDIMVKRCEPDEMETHGECTSLVVVYEHQHNGDGLLMITNGCKKLCHNTVVSRVEERAEETEVVDENANSLIKEDGPEQGELDGMAPEVTEEWKEIGRILLGHLRGNEVAAIDIDERGVKEKATIMFQTWKRSRGSEATYRELYKALTDPTVNRIDIAQRYCLVDK